MKSKILLLILLVLFFNNCSQLGIDVEPPEIKDYYPHHNSYGIPENSNVMIEFSEPMDEISVENNMQIELNGSSVPGKFNWDSDSKKVYYIFDKELSTGKQYIVSLGTDAADKVGNKLTQSLLFSFYVGNDTTPPVVLSETPANLSTNVDKNSDIYIFFSESMDIKSVQDNFSISPDVNGVYMWENNNTVFHYHLTKPLAPSTRYFVTLGENAADTSGLKLNNEFSFTFITGDSYTIPSVLGVYKDGDTRLPVSARYWTNYQQYVDKTSHIVVVFDKPMSHIKTESAFSISPSISGSFTWTSASNDIMIFHPDTAFKPETTYKILVDSTAEDNDNHRLNSSFELYFVVNNSNSLYLRLTNVSANNGAELIENIVNEIPLNSTETNTFLIKFNLAPPNKLDISSFQNSVSISRISGWGDSSYSGAIFDISYSPDYTAAYLKLGDLSTNNYYKLSFTGDTSGIMDIYQNYMQKNVEFIFLTK